MFKLLQAAGSLCSVTSKFEGRPAVSTTWRSVQSVTLPRRPIYRQKWTSEDDDALIKLHRAGSTYQEIADRLERSHRSICCRLVRLRSQRGEEVARKLRANPWTPEEDTIILESRRQKHSWARTLELLPHRRPETLSRRYYRLSGNCFEQTPRASPKRSLYSREEDARLLHLSRHEKLSLAQVSLLMLRPRTSVIQRARYLSRIKDPPFISTVAQELQELKHTNKLPEDFYGHSGGVRYSTKDRSTMLEMAMAGSRAREIAASLGRSVAAVQAFSRQARKADARFQIGGSLSRWSEEEESQLLLMKAKGHTTEQIAAAMSRTTSSISNKVNELSSKKSRPPKTEKEIKSE